MKAVILVFAVLAASWLGYWLAQPFSPELSDFPQFYAPARLIVSGRGSEAYRLASVIALQNQCFPGMGERVAINFWPPPSLIWLLPLGLLTGPAAVVVWKILQAVAAAAALLVLRYVFALSDKGFLWLSTGFCMSGPAFAAAHIDQPAFMLLCALAVAISALKRQQSWTAAAALAFLMVKPQDGLPFLVYLAGARRLKELALTAGFVLVSALIICVVIGPQGITDYIQSITSSVDNGAVMQPELGPTVRGQLLRFFPAEKTAILVVSGLLCLLTLVWIFKSGIDFAASSASIEAGLLIAVPLGLVTCLHLHSYDLLLLTPSAITILAGPVSRAVSPVLVLAGILLTGVFMVPFYIFIHYHYLLRDHGLLNPQFVVLLALSISSAYLARRYQDKL